MGTLVARCAGLDVHKDSVTACVRVPGEDGGRRSETRSFSATTAGLLLLAEWLTSYGVIRAGWSRPGATGSRSGSCSRARWSAGC